MDLSVWLLWLMVFVATWLRGWRVLRHGSSIRRYRHTRRLPVEGLPMASSCKIKPPWVKDEVLRLKALMADSGCRRIADTFNRSHAEQAVSVGKTYVSELIRRHEYEIRQLRQRFKHRRPQPLPINRIWALDLTGKGDAWGQHHAMLGILDHGSRRALCLQALARKNTLTLLGHLLIAIGRFGKPTIIRTDNESTFTSRRFRRALLLLGIRHQTTEPGCPWQNGRVERLFGTLKQTLDQLAVASGHELQQALTLFRFWYNAVRPHQHLAGRTPLEVWEGIDPYRQPVTAAIWFEALEGRLTGYYLRR